MSRKHIALLLAALSVAFFQSCQKDEPNKPRTVDKDLVSSLGKLNDLKPYSPGQVIVWKDGTYTGLKLTLTGKGTAEKPIVLRAQTPGGVVLHGTSSITLDGSYLVVEGFKFEDITMERSSIIEFSRNSDHCRVSECSIDGSKVPADPETNTHWVLMHGLYNEVSHCSFTDKRNLGVMLECYMDGNTPPEHLVANNYFTRPNSLLDASGSGINGQEVIRVGTSGYCHLNFKCTVRDNWFYHCHGERGEIVSSKSCENTYDGNLIENSMGALALRHGHRNTVTGNWFIDTEGLQKTGGIRVIGEDHLVEGNTMIHLMGSGYTAALCLMTGEQNAEAAGYPPVKNAIIRGNTIRDCANGIVIGYPDTYPVAPQNVLFENNTVTGSAIKVTNTPAANLTWKGNTFFNCPVSGITLELAQKAPVLPSYDSKLDAIRSAAGTTWK